jgi:hypothetical protein
MQRWSGAELRNVMGFEVPLTDPVSVINFSGRNLKCDYGFFPEKLIIA